MHRCLESHQMSGRATVEANQNITDWGQTRSLLYYTTARDLAHRVKVCLLFTIIRSAPLVAGEINKQSKHYASACT
jgi:hypothetical protein